MSLISMLSLIACGPADGLSAAEKAAAIGAVPEEGLLITEVMANPVDGDDYGRQWFEVKNITDTTFNLQDLVVKAENHDGADFHGLVRFSSETISPGEYVVLGHGTARTWMGDVDPDALFGNRALMDIEGTRLAMYKTNADYHSDDNEIHEVTLSSNNIKLGVSTQLDKDYLPSSRDNEPWCFTSGSKHSAGLVNPTDCNYDGADEPEPEPEVALESKVKVTVTITPETIDAGYSDGDPIEVTEELILGIEVENTTNATLTLVSPNSCLTEAVTFDPKAPGVASSIVDVNDCGNTETEHEITASENLKWGFDFSGLNANETGTYDLSAIVELKEKGSSSTTKIPAKKDNVVFKAADEEVGEAE